ncbi:MAG: GWxTD domain-containing protein [Thermoanaerobaculia bacterium]
MALPCPPLRRPRSRPGTLGRTALALLLFLFSAGAALAISEEELEPEFRAWLDEVGPIITKAERTAFLNLEKDYQREAFIERFWQARDPYPDTARNEMREAWETRVEEARLYFGSTKEERAKLYLLNGAPAARFEGQCAATTWPIEVWAYTRSERIKEDVIFFVFYRPFNQGPFRLWYPYDGISVLMQFPRPGTPDQQLLYELADSCIARDDIPTAIAAILRRGRMDFERWLEMALEPPPPVSPEWVSTFNSYSTDVPPDAAQLAAELTVAFPGRRQSRTVVQGLLAVDVAKAKLSDVAGAQSYNFLLNGEILLGRKLFDSFRYKFDLPADTVTGPTIPLVFERFLRPGKYTMILKLEDTIGGGFFRKMMEIDIPTVEGPMPMAVDAESALLFEEANAALSTLDNTIRLVRPHGDIQAGLVRFDTLITGNAISSVRFHLDGRPLLTKNKPPYSVELDLGQVPRTRVLRVEGFDRDDREIAWDEIQVNASSHRFRARLIEPRRKAHYEKSLRAEAEVEVPEDESLDHVEFYLNETLVATLYQAPFTQPIVLPPDGQVAYVRVVAYLVDGNSTEDLVFINAPENLEEIDVQFVELFTTRARSLEPSGHRPRSRRLLGQRGRRSADHRPLREARQPPDPRGDPARRLGVDGAQPRRRAGGGARVLREADHPQGPRRAHRLQRPAAACGEAHQQDREARRRSRRPQGGARHRALRLGGLLALLFQRRQGPAGAHRALGRQGRRQPVQHRRDARLRASRRSRHLHDRSRHPARRVGDTQGAEAAGGGDRRTQLPDQGGERAGADLRRAAAGAPFALPPRLPVDQPVAREPLPRGRRQGRRVRSRSQDAARLLPVVSRRGARPAGRSR